MTDDPYASYNQSYQDWSGTTKAANWLSNPGAAIDDFFNGLRTRSYAAPDPNAEQMQRLSAPRVGELSGSYRAPGAVGSFAPPAGPPQRFNVNLLGDGNPVMGLAGSPIGQAFLGTPGSQRGGTIDVGPFDLATAPVNFQNFATYAREGTLSAITSALGHHYQQPDQPYAAPAGPENHDDLLTNLGQGDWSNVLDNVIDGVSTVGDAVNAPLVAFSNFMRQNAAQSRGQAIRDLVRSGGTIGDPIARLSSLWDQSRFDWTDITKKAVARGISTEDMAAELWDLSPEIVTKIQQNPNMDDHELNALVADQPFSYDPAVNLIAELGVTLAPMLAGGWALRSASAGLKGLGVLGKIAEGDLDLGKLGFLGRPIQAAERIGSWSLQKAWRAYQFKPVNAAATIAGLNTKGVLLGGGIRFGEWAFKQAAAISGNQAAVQLADQWLWEMPLSNNPGLNLVDAFAVHPLRILRGEHGSPTAVRDTSLGAPVDGTPVVKVAGRTDPLPIDRVLTRPLRSIADSTLSDLHDRIGTKLGWQQADLERAFNPDSPTGLTEKDLKNGLLYVAAQVVRERHEAELRYMAPEAGIVDRNTAFWQQHGAEAVGLLRDELTGKGTAISDAITQEFWTRSSIIEASDLGREGGIGPYDPAIALQRFTSWILASKRFAGMADEALVPALREDVNTQFLDAFRSDIRKRYKPGDRITARDLNHLQTYIPSAIADSSGFLRGRKRAPVVTRRALEGLLDRLDAQQSRAELADTAPGTAKVPVIAPEDVGSVKATALAFRLRQDTVQQLEDGLAGTAELTGAVPPDLERVLMDILPGVQEAHIRADPATYWPQAVEWYGRMRDSAAARGEAQAALDRFGRHLDERTREGAVDVDAMKRVRQAISHPYSAKEIAANPLLGSIVEQRDTELSAFIDRMGAWLDSPLRKMKVRQLADGARIMLETDGFGPADVSLLENAIARFEKSGVAVSPAVDATILSPELHPLEKLGALREAMDAGLKLPGPQEARIHELGDLTETYGALVAEAYGPGSPVTKAVIDKLTNEVASNQDELTGLREQLRGLAGLIDRGPSQQISDDLTAFYERAGALGHATIGAGKVEIPHWHNLPIEPAGIVEATNAKVRDALIAAADQDVASKAAVLADFDRLAGRATSLIGKRLEAADYVFDEQQPLESLPTKKAAMDAARGYQAAGIATRIRKVGSRFKVERGELTPEAVARRSSAEQEIQAAYDAGRIAEGQALNVAEGVARGGTPESGGAIKPSTSGSTRPIVPAPDFGPNVELVPADQLVPFREIDREITPKHATTAGNLDELTADIKANGFKEPVDLHYDPATNRVLLGEGNHRLAAAIRLGVDVPTRVVVDDLSNEPKAVQLDHPLADVAKPSDIINRPDVPAAEEAPVQNPASPPETAPEAAPAPEVAPRAGAKFRGHGSADEGAVTSDIAARRAEVAQEAATASPTDSPDVWGDRYAEAAIRRWTDAGPNQERAFERPDEHIAQPYLHAAARSWMREYGQGVRPRFVVDLLAPGSDSVREVKAWFSDGTVLTNRGLLPVEAVLPATSKWIDAELAHRAAYKEFGWLAPGDKTRLAGIRKRVGELVTEPDRPRVAPTTFEGPGTAIPEGGYTAQMQSGFSYAMEHWIANDRAGEQSLLTTMTGLPGEPVFERMGIAKGMWQDATPPIVEQISEQSRAAAAEHDAFAAAEAERQAAFTEHTAAYEQARMIPHVDVVEPPGTLDAAVAALKPTDQAGYDALVERYGLEEVSAAENRLERSVEASSSATPRPLDAPTHMIGPELVNDPTGPKVGELIVANDGTTRPITAVTPEGVTFDRPEQPGSNRQRFVQIARPGQVILGPDSFATGPKGGDKIGGNPSYRVRAVNVDGTLELAESGPSWKRSPITKRLQPGTTLEYDKQAGLWHETKPDFGPSATPDRPLEPQTTLRAGVGLIAEPDGRWRVALTEHQRAQVDKTLQRSQYAKMTAVDLEAAIPKAKGAKQRLMQEELARRSAGQLPGQMELPSEGGAAPVTPRTIPAPTEVTFLDPQDNRTPIRSRVVLVDAGDVLTSDQLGFPANLQPRSRTIRASSDAQIREYARDLQPDKLLGTTEGAAGMPVVTPEGAVLAGNGRTQAIRLSSDDVFNRYRARIVADAPKYGFDVSVIDKMQRPMLVRELVDVSPETQHRLAWQLNEMPMGDLAPSLASAITREDVRQLKVGDAQDLGEAIRSGTNSGAVARIIEHLPADARSRYFDPKTGVNELGAQLVEGALLSKLLRADDRTLPTFESARAVVFDAIEQGGEEMRRITNGVAEAAGQIVKAQERAEAGTAGPEILRFSDDLTPALARILSLRRSGLNNEGVVRMLDNVTAFDEATINPLQTHLAKILAASSSQREVRTFMRAVARAADAGDEGVMPMFEDVRLDYTGVLNDGLRAWNTLRREAGKPEFDPFPNEAYPYDTALTPGVANQDGASLPPVNLSQPLAANELATAIAARHIGEPVHAVASTIEELPDGPTFSLLDPHEHALAEMIAADPDRAVADLNDAVETARAYTGLSNGPGLSGYFDVMLEAANEGTLEPADWWVLRNLSGGLVRKNTEGRYNMALVEHTDKAFGQFATMQSTIMDLVDKLRGRTAVKPEDAVTVLRPHAQLPISADELAATAGPDVPFDVAPPEAAAITETTGHVITTNENPALERAIRKQAGAPASAGATRRIMEFNAPDAAVQAERLSALRQQASAALEDAQRRRADAEASPIAPTETASVFPDSNLRGMWDKLMRSGVDQLAPAMGSAEPRGLASLADAVESIDRGMYLDPQTGVGLTEAEAAELRSYLLRVMNGTLETAISRRAGRSVARFTARVKPPDDFAREEIQQRAKAIMDDVAARVVRDPDAPALDGWEGTQYIPSPLPTRSKASPGTPLSPRILLRDAFADDVIPGLHDELRIGRMESVARRVATSRASRLIDHVMGARPEKGIRAQAIANFKGELAKMADADNLPAEEAARVDRVGELAFQKWRDYIEQAKLGPYQIYRRINLMGPENMDRLFGQAVDEVYGDKPPTWVADMANAGVKPSKLWRQADNRLRGYIRDSGLPLSQGLEALYGKAADLGEAPGRWITVTYHVMRFLGDLRWLGLEAVEPALLTVASGGLRPVLESAKLTKGLVKGKAPIAIGEDVQRAMWREYAHWATSLSDTAQSSGVRQRYLIRELARRQTRPFRDAVLEMAQREPELARTIREQGDTADGYVRRLERDWTLAEQGTRKFKTAAEAERAFKPWLDGGFIDKATYSEYVKARSYTSHPAIEAELAKTVGDPLAQALYTRLAVINHDLFHDLTETMFGQADRSNLQRAINHPFLYWPLSYQLKATKWLLRFMLDESFGVDTGAATGALIQQVWNAQRQRLQTDPEYAKRLQANSTLFFIASMLLPITPTDIGVSLSPFTRMLADPSYQRQGGVFGWGPFYTYMSLMPRLIGEQTKPGGLLENAPFADKLRQAFPQQITVGGPKKPTSTIDAENIRIAAGLPPATTEEPTYPRLP